MKKVIEVTINNTIFKIEEDAYLKLNKYLDSIYKHYQSFDEAKEIIGDIEDNISDKLKEEIKKGKKYIDIKVIDKIIKTIGTIEEISEEENSKKTIRSKRLFRDSDNKIISGVCSGLATYFGLDPTIVRLVFVLTAIIYGSSIWIYLILWLVIPQTKTEGQKLMMKGEFNLDKIEELIKNGSKKIKEESQTLLKNESLEKGSKKILNFFDKIFSIFGNIAKSILRAISVIISISFIVIMIGSIILISGIFGLLFNLNSISFVSDIPLTSIVASTNYHLTLIFLFVLIIIPLFVFVYLGFSLIRLKNPFKPNKIKISLGLVWLAALILASIYGASLTLQLEDNMKTSSQSLDYSKSINLQDFKKIEIHFDRNRYIFQSENHPRIKVKKGEEFKIEAQGPFERIEELKIELEEDTLKISNNQKYCLFCFKDAVIDITLPQLEAIKASGWSILYLSDFEKENLDIQLEKGFRLRNYPVK